MCLEVGPGWVSSQLQAWGIALPDIPWQEGQPETAGIRPVVGLLVKTNWNIHWSSPRPLPPLPAPSSDGTLSTAVWA